MNAEHLKKHLFFALLIILSITFFSCENEDQKVIAQLSGDWTVTDVRMLSVNAYNITFPTKGQINFGNCELANAEGGRCGGELAFEGMGTVNFGYSATQEPLSINLLADAGYPFEPIGQFAVRELTNKLLVFEGTFMPLENPHGLNASQLKFRVVCVR